MTAKVIPINAWKKDIKRGDNGKPVKGLTNVVTFVRGVAGKDLRFNELSDTIEYQNEAIRKSDYAAIQLLMEPHGLIPADRDLTAAVNLVAVENAYHPIREYLESLPKWDNVNRLDSMFPRLFRSPNTAYEQAIGVRYMIASVARVFDPGCKMDNMLVLEGDQGTYKSTALKVLFSQEYFTETVGLLRDYRRFVEQILGKWCVEFAEFASLNDVGVDTVKAITAFQIDRTMRNYSHTGSSDHPRRCVMAATINPIPGCGYLKDPTGGRRFWPVKCGVIDIERLTGFRDKLWAEALHRYQAGERWHLTEDEYALAATEQTARQARDPWEELLIDLNPEHAYRSKDLFQMYLGFDKGKQGKADSDRLAAVMRTLGRVLKRKYFQQDSGRSLQEWAWVVQDMSEGQDTSKTGGVS